jgi:uncharacterized membrane protein required for colicin V production
MHDKVWAGLAGVLVLVIVSIQKYSPASLEFLLSLTRPGATILLLGGVVLAYMKDLHITAVVLMVGTVFLLKSLYTWQRTQDRSVFLDIGKDLARFEPANSIDLQFANGTAKHDQPHFLEPMQKFDDLLVFPPSDETLRQMNGPTIQ